MFWADKITTTIEEELKEKIAQKAPLIIRDEKTASGRIHVGSMRGVAIHGILSEILKERGIESSFLYEINDFDPMDALPSYLDEGVYGRYMGNPLCTIPSPDGKAQNFAEYFAKEFIETIEESGFHPTYYRNSELYTSGKMNEVIRIALTEAATIRAIYKKVSGQIKEDDWLPLNVVCEKCGKLGTTKVTSFDGENVTYSCQENMVVWARGCSHEGIVSPFDGNGKLPWKVEWAGKFRALGVDIEGAGKDHSTRGGSRDVANHIAEEVFNHKAPFDVPYEFILVGGKKMSSSRAVGSSAREIATLLPPSLFRLLLLGKKLTQAVDFEPDGDTIPILFDRYDSLAESYFNKKEDDEARIFELIHLPEERGSLQKHFLPRFSIVSFLTQMPHMNIEEEVQKMKGSNLTIEDKKELALRVEYAYRWLAEYAPENYRYELQLNVVPEGAKNFNKEVKKALKKVYDYIDALENLDGQELHTKLHEIRNEENIEPDQFFSALYLSFLGKENGPKAGWFLSFLKKDFLKKRLKEVIE